MPLRFEPYKNVLKYILDILMDESQWNMFMNSYKN